MKKNLFKTLAFFNLNHDKAAFDVNSVLVSHSEE